MGSGYSAHAFFGTFVPRRSEVGEILHKFIESFAPAETSIKGVWIGFVGNLPMGEEWIVVRTSIFHGGCGEAQIEAPRRLIEDKAGKSTLMISAFLRSQGIDPNGLPPIGWHFAGTVL